MNGHGCEPGTRVGALMCIDDDKCEAVLFGFGVYEGERTLTEATEAGDEGPVGLMSLMMRVLNRPNPFIRLDSGQVVWGCECWWGPEKAVAEKLKACEDKGYSIVISNIDEVRARVREAERAEQAEQQESPEES